MNSVIIMGLLSLVACASHDREPERPEPGAEAPDVGEAAQAEPESPCQEGWFHDEVFGCQTCPRFFHHDEILGWCTRWVPAGQMAIERSHHTATLLNDDRVLVVGGVSKAGRSIARTEIFTPAEASWREGPPLASPRKGHTATLIDDGRVLVVGGDDGNKVLSSVEIFDPEADAWSAGPTLKAGRMSHAAVKLADGRVMVIGGRGSSGVIDDVEILDPSELRWTVAAPLPQGRCEASATLLGDGAVMVVGGAAPTSGIGGILSALAEDTRLASVVRYEPSVNRWVEVGRLPRSIGVNAAALLGEELVVFPAIQIALNGAEEIGTFRIDLQSMGIRVEHPISRGRAPRVAPQASGVVVTWGRFSSLASAEPSPPAQAIWVPPGELGLGDRRLAAMLVHRHGHTLTTLADGRILAAGGCYGVAETHRAEVLEWVQGLRNARVVPPDDPLRPRPLR